MYTYVAVKRTIDSDPVCIRRSDGANIPIESANIDYQEYLRWLADENIPDYEVLQQE